MQLLESNDIDHHLSDLKYIFFEWNLTFNQIFIMNVYIYIYIYLNHPPPLWNIYVMALMS